MKKYTVIFSPAALHDIEQAVIYYNDQQHDLGKRFAKEIHSKLESVKASPFYASIRFNNVRCAVVGVFPFMIHYSIDETTSTVTILSVYSTYRRPLW